MLHICFDPIDIFIPLLYGMKMKIQFCVATQIPGVYIIIVFAFYVQKQHIYQVTNTQ